MNTPSLRKTRAAVGDIIGVVKNHAGHIDKVGKDVGALAGLVAEIAKRGEETREIVDAIVDRGFLGRLKWLVTGH